MSESSSPRHLFSPKFGGSWWPLKRWRDEEGGMCHVCAAVCDRIQLSISPPCCGWKRESGEPSPPPHPLFPPSAPVVLVTSLLLLLSLSCCHHPTPNPPFPLSPLSVIFLPPPPSTPASSVSPASVINLFSSHLTAVEWFLSERFAAAHRRPTNNSHDSTRPCDFLYPLVSLSEGPNYLNSKFNLVPALTVVVDSHDPYFFN